MSDDIFNGTNGNDTFNGGDGNDTVTFAGNAAGYRIELVNGRVRVVDVDLSDGNTGTDTITGVETLAFADKNYGLSNDLIPGGEARVESFQGGNQSESAVTVLSDGGYVVTWTSSGQEASAYGIYSQRFDASGMVAGAETHVNTYTSSWQDKPAITALSDGGYVITWESDGQDGASEGVYAQRFDADGTKVGVETRINTTTEDFQSDPSVAALADGGYVITWQSYGDPNDNYDIYAQRYNASGVAVGTETRINTETDYFQGSPVVTALTDGGYLIAWTSDSQSGIYAQRYNASGAAVGVETRISAKGEFALTALADGGYAVTFVAMDSDGWGIYALRYDASGVAVGTETRIDGNITSSWLKEPAIAALADGGYIVVWASFDQDGDGWGLYSQRFNASGAAVGVETRVNTLTNGWQDEPAIAALPDGGYVVTWTSGSNILAQRFDSSGQPVMVDFIISGTGGADVLRSGAGQLTLAGQTGDDTYVLTDLEKIAEGVSEGIDTVQAGFSYVLGANLENLTLTGTEHIDGEGNGANNILIGNSGRNVLNGRSGVDQLHGGLGNDTYILADDDAVIESANQGNDIVRASISYRLGANIEQLTLTGADAINGTGNSTDNVITGNGGVNSLNGSAGDDTLDGNKGDDLLNGGSGRDSLAGGKGADSFRFNATLSASTNVDTIRDFSVGGGDVIQLDNAIFRKLANTGALGAGNFKASLSGNAVNSNDYILYETDTGKLFYDADGNGSGAKVLFSIVGTLTHPMLTAVEFVIV